VNNNFNNNAALNRVNTLLILNSSIQLNNKRIKDLLEKEGMDDLKKRF
jgi:hypothetical protein